MCTHEHTSTHGIPFSFVASLHSLVHIRSFWPATLKHTILSCRVFYAELHCMAVYRSHGLRVYCQQNLIILSVNV